MSEHRTAYFSFFKNRLGNVIYTWIASGIKHL